MLAHGVPQSNIPRAELTDTLTSIIFTGSVQHQVNNASPSPFHDDDLQNHHHHHDDHRHWFIRHFRSSFHLFMMMNDGHNHQRHQYHDHHQHHDPHHQAVNAPQFTYSYQPHRPVMLTRFPSFIWDSGVKNVSLDSETNMGSYLPLIFHEGCYSDC